LLEEKIKKKREIKIKEETKEMIYKSKYEV
jgi:hypothetical protein